MASYHRNILNQPEPFSIEDGHHSARPLPDNVNNSEYIPDQPYENQPYIEEPNPGRSNNSTTPNRNFTILMASNRILQHSIFVLWTILYNSPQIISIIVLLGKYWNQHITYYVKPHRDSPWLPVTTWGTSACTTPIHIWSVIYAATRLFVIFYEITRFIRTRNEMTLFEFEMSGIAKLHRVLGLFGTIWHILGLVWVINEQTCDTTQYKPFLVAVIFVTVAWVSMLLPFLLLLLLLPFTIFCGPALIRFIGRFREPEQGEGADDQMLDLLPEGHYKKDSSTTHGVVEDDKTHRRIIVNNDSCPICLSDFLEDEGEIAILPCEHIYHSSCVKEWLKINSICCMCRQRLTSDVLEQVRSAESV